MQKLNTNSTLPKIKESNAQKIAEAMLNIKSPTRADIAKRASVTEMTVCRAMSKLSDAGVIEEHFTKNGKTAASLSFSSELNFIIIDLTLYEYEAYLLDASNNIIEKYSYLSKSSNDLIDDLIIFLERAKEVFSKKVKHFCSIAVIADRNCISDNEINSALCESFLFPADLILDIPSCLQNLIFSAIDCHFPADSLYYLNLGKRNLAYFVKDSFYIKSSIEALNDTDGRRLSEKIECCINAPQLYDIIFKVVNSASAILDAKLFLIESDRFILGSNLGFSISEKLKATFDDKRKLLVSDVKPPYYIKGASVSLQKKIIKNILEN